AQNVAGATLYDLACLYALSSAVAGQDARLPPAEREKLVDYYAACTLELLAQAQTKDYFKNRAVVEHLKKDRDLDSLRSRGDFKKFVANLEKQLRSGAE